MLRLKAIQLKSFSYENILQGLETFSKKLIIAYLLLNKFKKDEK